MRKNLSIVSGSIAALAAIAVSSNAWDAAHRFPNPSFDASGFTPVGAALALSGLLALATCLGSLIVGQKAE